MNFSFNQTFHQPKKIHLVEAYDDAYTIKEAFDIFKTFEVSSYKEISDEIINNLNKKEYLEILPGEGIYKLLLTNDLLVDQKMEADAIIEEIGEDEETIIDELDQRKVNPNIINRIIKFIKLNISHNRVLAEVCNPDRVDMLVFMEEDNYIFQFLNNYKGRHWFNQYKKENSESSESSESYYSDDTDDTDDTDGSDSSDSEPEPINEKVRPTIE
jgi:hypothetical protein